MERASWGKIVIAFLAGVVATIMFLYLICKILPAYQQEEDDDPPRKIMIVRSGSFLTSHFLHKCEVFYNCITSDTSWTP